MYLIVISNKIWQIALKCESNLGVCVQGGDFAFVM